jgi:hypothetical protein
VSRRNHGPAGARLVFLPGWAISREVRELPDEVVDELLEGAGSIGRCRSRPLRILALYAGDPP